MADVDGSATQQWWVCRQEHPGALGHEASAGLTQRMDALVCGALDEASHGGGRVLGADAHLTGEAGYEATAGSFKALHRALAQARHVRTGPYALLPEVVRVDGPWCSVEAAGVPALGVVIEFPRRWVVLCVAVGDVSPARWTVTQEEVVVCACGSRAVLPSLGADDA